MFTPLTGRSVIVTGASKGIGRGIALGFVRAGANVLITGRDEAAARKAADEITDMQDVTGTISAIAADVAREDDSMRVAQAAEERHGGVDIVVANAGVFPSSPLSELTADDVDHVLGVNLKGTMLSVRACLDALARSRHGRVIVISSITGPVTGYAGWAHYAASKAGQLGFVRSAALELARVGVTINAILPGNVATEGVVELGEEYLRSMAASVPLGRLGTVEDVAHMALFLATDEAAYITGQAFVVDGGQVIPESLAAMEQ